MSDPSAIDRLLAWPRAKLANLPTPLIPMARLARELGVDDLHVKMDAETGFALGGNKVRKLEYELERGRLEGVTCVITAGGPQSNHCRVTAAFAAKAGLDCILVTQGPRPETATGNALLHRLFGAEVRTVPDRAARVPGMDEAAADVRRAGGTPIIVPIGASSGLGCLGYARALLELLDQLDALGHEAETTRVFHSSSSCGTLAGLVLGRALAGREDIVLHAVSADATAEELTANTLRIAREGIALLGSNASISAEGFAADDSEVGEGYGIPTRASEVATSLFGRLEGLVLDPTYTAKAAAGMIHWVQEHGTGPGERIVFLHTGGHPGLLA